MHDLVVRDGLVIDGSGAAGQHVDVAIDGDRIVDVGVDLPRGRREIDADGRLVTPGFVDIHTHSDAQVSWDPWMTPSSWHGVTTVVAGNCGVGFAPVAPERHAWLIELMEGVEDIPGSAMVEGITWEWESFPEYLDAIARRPLVLDYGTQLAHGPLRAYVMGERGAANEPATADDIAAMRRLTVEALRAGALGVSTSRTPIHRSKAGELVPGTMASADELLGIGEALREVGHGVFQYAPEHTALPTREWGWMRALAARTGCTVSVNLNQPDDAPDIWKDVLLLLDEAALDGVPIVAQAAGRSIGMLACLEGSMHPLMFHPVWGELAGLSHDQLVAALGDPELRRRIIDDVPDDGGFYDRVVVQRASRMYPVVNGAIDYEPGPEASVAAIAGRQAARPTEVLLDALLDDNGRGMVYTPIFNYAYGDLSFSYELHRHPATRMGLSDAGAHCGAICDGGTPTFMLTPWTRDRTRGPLLALEHVIHRQTRQTAELYGLRDRGLIAPGMKAHLNVIDYDALRFDAPRMAYDFPAGARRLVQRAQGYAATICSGVPTVIDDLFTGELPGRLIRGPQTVMHAGSRVGDAR